MSLTKLLPVILLMMALTGLSWSFSWYRTGFYSQDRQDRKAGSPLVPPQQREAG